jgi:hypothetical protein
VRDESLLGTVHFSIVSGTTCMLQSGLLQGARIPSGLAAARELLLAAGSSGDLVMALKMSGASNRRWITCGFSLHCLSSRNASHPVQAVHEEEEEDKRDGYCTVDKLSCQSDFATRHHVRFAP